MKEIKSSYDLPITPQKREKLVKGFTIGKLFKKIFLFTIFIFIYSSFIQFDLFIFQKLSFLLLLAFFFIVPEKDFPIYFFYILPITDILRFEQFSHTITPFVEVIFLIRFFFVKKQTIKLRFLLLLLLIFLQQLLFTGLVTKLLVYSIGLLFMYIFIENYTTNKAETFNIEKIILPFICSVTFCNYLTIFYKDLYKFAITKENLSYALESARINSFFLPVEIAKYRFFGLTSNPTTLASFCIISLCLLSFLFLDKKLNFFLFFSFSLMLSILGFFSLSKMFLIGFLVIFSFLILFIFLKKEKIKTKTLHLLTYIGLLIVIIFIFNRYFFAHYVYRIEINPLSGRDIILKQYLYLIRLNPLILVSGIGIDKAFQYMNAVSQKLSLHFRGATHNGFIDIIFSNGILGLIPLYFMFQKYLQNGFRKVKKKTHLIFLTLPIFLIFPFIGFMFASPSIIYFFGFTLMELQTITLKEEFKH